MLELAPMKRLIPFAVCLALEIVFVILGLRELNHGNPNACATAMFVATLFAGAALLFMPERRGA
jgi:hypothetical protein